MKRCQQMLDVSVRGVNTLPNRKYTNDVTVGVSKRRLVIRYLSVLIHLRRLSTVTLAQYFFHAGLLLSEGPVVRTDASGSAHQPRPSTAGVAVSCLRRCPPVPPPTAALLAPRRGRGWSGSSVPARSARNRSSLRRGGGDG